MIVIHGGQTCQNVYVGTLEFTNKKIIGSSGDSQVCVTYDREATLIKEKSFVRDV